MNSFVIEILPEVASSDNTTSYTLSELKDKRIYNVPVQEYHNFLTKSEYAKNFPIHFEHERSKSFVGFNAYEGIYLLDMFDYDDYKDVKLNMLDHLPKEYSDDDWSMFVELEDGTIKYLFGGVEELGNHDCAWVKHFYGEKAKLFAIRKKTAEYVFKNIY